jgi:shikimate 5-dehydrogenase
VNTIVRERNGILVGRNTDAPGFSNRYARYSTKRTFSGWRACWVPAGGAGDRYGIGG